MKSETTPTALLKPSSATRVYRGTRYAIEVRNPNRVCRGVKSVKVDGTFIAGNTLPGFDDGQTHRVVVVLGEA